MVDSIHFLLLVIAVEAMSEILVAAKITDGFRRWLFLKAAPEVPEDWPEGKDPPKGCWLFRFWNDVLKCGYCTSVWVAGLAAVLSPLHLSGCPFANWLVSLLVIHRLSNLFHIGLMLVKKGRVGTYDMEVTVKGLHDGSSGETRCPERPPPGP